MRCRTRGRLGHAGSSVEGGEDEGGSGWRVAHAASAEVTMTTTELPGDALRVRRLRRRQRRGGLLVGRSSSNRRNRCSRCRQSFRMGSRRRFVVARVVPGVLVEHVERPARSGCVEPRRGARTGGAIHALLVLSVGVGVQVDIMRQRRPGRRCQRRWGAVSARH